MAIRIQTEEGIKGRCRMSSIGADQRAAEIKRRMGT